MAYKKHFGRGFSLIEMLVVVSIVGMLTTILLVNYTGQLKKSRDQKRRTDAESIKLACNMYADQHSGYPTGNFNSGDNTWNVLATTLDDYISLSTIKDPQTPTYTYRYVGAINDCEITIFSEVLGSDLPAIKCKD